MSAAADPPSAPLASRTGAATWVVVGAALLACTAADPVASVARETCDGADDDANGIIDDLDANADGLCDCLRIGVAGYPGRQEPNLLIQRWMGTRAVPTTILPNEVLTPGRLADLDVLVLQDVRDGVAEGTVGREGIGLGIGRTYSDAEIEAVKAWVDAGGGLLTLAGFGATAGENANVNRILARFGLSYGDQPILAVRNGAPVPLTHWDGAHPIASGVSEVRVGTGFAVSGGNLVAWEPTPGAYDVGRAAESGRGHVFAWGDEWIGYDSQWSREPELQVRRLWTNAMRWLTRAGYCQVPPPR